MKKFKFKKEKFLPLTIGDIEDLGWQRQEDKEAKLLQNKNTIWFEKGNYFLIINYFEGIAIVRFFPKDPSIIDWMPDPETFRVTLKCPSKEHFEIITSLL